MRKTEIAFPARAGIARDLIAEVQALRREVKRVVRISIWEPGQSFHFDLSEKFARAIAGKILQSGLGEGVLLNVNVPNISESECSGVEITRQGKRVYGDSIVEKIDPRGREYFWVGGNGLSWVDEPETDFAAASRKKISVTPIRLDLTDYGAMEELKKWHFR